MTGNFTLNGKTYEPHYYTAEEIATQVLPSLYGVNIDNLTYGELAVTTKMYNHGWNIVSTYTFDFNDSHIQTVPSYRWFSLLCDECANVHQYSCFLTQDDGVELFDGHRRICKFDTIDDMFLYMNQLDRTEPIKFSSYENEKTVENLKSFDIHGIDGEIYTEETKVFPDGISMSELVFELDGSKCDEIKTKQAEE